MAAGQGAMGGLQLPDKGEYFRQRLTALIGTPMVKPRETLQAIERDYQRMATQMIAAKRLELEQLRGKRQQTELDRGVDYPHQERMAKIKRGPAKPPGLGEQRAQDVRGIAKGELDPEVVKQAYMAISMQGAGGGSGDIDPMTDAVLQKMLAEEVGKPTVDRPGWGTGDDYTPRQEALRRRQELAQSVVEQRLQRELGGGAARPQDEQTAAPSPMKGRRRGQRSFKSDYGKAAATTQPARRLIRMPDGTEKTIPQEQLEDFLATVPGAKLLK
jgi:hypothetical protein